MRKWWIVMVVVVWTATATATAAADRPFTPRFTTNDTGDVTIAAAPLMTCSPTGTNGAACPPARALSSVNGPAGSTNIASQSNNNYTMVNVDTDGDPATTVNSSTAQLTLPAGADVLFAGLYWGADQSAGNNGGAAPSAATPQARQAKFKVPGGVYQTLTATTLDAGIGANTNRYQGFSDVTALVSGAGAGTYAVGDVRAGTGGDRYAGWSLVVAYRDTAQPARNLTVFDGFTTIAANQAPTTIPVSGFQTPPAGPVRTSVGFVSYEGDLGLGGDSATLNATTLTNGANQSTNFFNSSISRNGASVTTRDPAFTNTLGYDSDLFNADGVLANGATDAAIRLTTSSDQYLPGVITFATELFAPKVALTKSVANLTRPGGPDEPGDVLRYTVVTANSGQDGADDVVVSDPVPPGTTYVPGSLNLVSGPGSPASPTDAAGDDRGEFDALNTRVQLRLGTGATAVVGGRLAPGTASAFTFDARIGDVPPRADIVNAAAATFVSQSLRVPLSGDSNAVATTVQAPDLALTKDHAPAFVAGARSTYRLVVSNVGNLASDASPVTVSDTVPATGFGAIANAGGAGWTCTVTGLAFTCTRTDALPAGESYPPILVDATVLDPAPASIVNVATVAGGGDAVTTNNTATDVGGSAQQADVRIVKTVDPGSVLSGQAVRYRLEVQNLGPSTATAVAVDDPIGAGLSGVTATPTRGTCTAAVACALGALAPGESVGIDVDATVTANDTTLTNTATVASGTPDPAPANNTASAPLAVAATADLQITKAASTPTPVAGAPGGLTYTVVVRNAGPGDATGVVLGDDLPPEFTPDTITAPAGFTCNAPGAGGALTCTAGALAAGSSATLTIVGTVAASAPATLVHNVTRVRADTPDPDTTNNAAEVTGTATPASDLAVTKEWGTATGAFATLTVAAPNTDVRLRLTVTNLGPSIATGVVLSDSLPPNVIYVSDDEPACAASGGLVSCTVGTLAPGAAFDVLVTVHLAPGAGGTIIPNSARAAGDQGDPVGSDDTATAPIAVTPAADLALAKSASTPTATVGQPVTFTVAVTNVGPNVATGVQVTDTLPAGLDLVSSADCSASGATLTCAVADIAVGATATLTYVARPTDAGAGGPVINGARVTGTLVDPDAFNNSAAATVDVAPRADLRVRKLTADTTPDVDQDTTFTLVATNDGPNTATNATLSDPVPTGMRFVSAAPDCRFTAATATVTCDLGDLAAGAEARRTVTLRPTAALAGQTVTNAVSVAADQPDPDPSDNTDRVDVAVRPQVDLRLTKVAATPTVTAGGTATYTLVVTNDGPSPATATTLQDPLPPGTTFVSATPGQGACSARDNLVTCALGTIPVGGAAQVVLVVRVAAGAGGGTLDNRAEVAGAETEARPQDNAATASVAVVAAPPVPDEHTTLAITKTVDRSTADTAHALTYTVTVANRGPGSARDVTVTDAFGRPVAVGSVRATQGTCTPGPPITCRLGTLAPGATAVVTVVARATTAGRLTNSASVVAANAAGSAPASVSTAVSAARARLELRKRAGRTRVSAGGSVPFTITLQNHSDHTAFGVRVCDRLPAGLTFVAAPGARFNGRQACWTLKTLGANARRTFLVRARADRLHRARVVTNRVDARAANAATVRAHARSVRIGAVKRERGGGVTG